MATAGSDAIGSDAAGSVATQPRPAGPRPLESPQLKRQLIVEVWLLLGVSLGASGLHALIDLIRDLTAPGGLANTTATLNPTLAPGQPWIDLALNLLDILTGLVPAFLAIYLLNREPGDGRGLLGIDLRRPRFDLGAGVGLAALIGIPGLGLYVLARHLGINATVAAANLPHVWWAYPVLVLSAVQNGVYEEVIVVGYLLTRLQQFGWRTPYAIAASAVLRGSYHLYQGFGGFIGNAIMGVIFGLFYKRFGRVTPLIVAHSILDIVSFVGYTIFVKHLAFLR
jgi:membrane protease YdiL (CAAX protease family)